MEQTLAKPSIARNAWKIVAAVASTGAALASVINFLFSQVGEGTRPTLANFGAHRIRLTPAADTAIAIGDTIPFAAIVTDKSGSMLMGARPMWRSEDSTIATVASDGGVIARKPGATTIVAQVRNHVARAHIVVAPKVALVRIAGDSALRLPEGERHTLRALAMDARGHEVTGRRLVWRSDDTGVVRVDSTGTLAARDPGRAILTVNVDGIAAHSLVSVVAVPAAVSLVGGGAQHAIAGDTLPRPVTVRVMSRGGRPMEGALVRFKATRGSVEPQAAMTDAEGRARVSWVLGLLPGRQSLTATVDGVDTAVTVVAEADPSPKNTRAALIGDAASAVAGAALVRPIGVRLADSVGRRLADVPVRWVAENGGTVTALWARSDSLGEARATWTLGGKAGPQRVRAYAGPEPGILLATFSATAKAGAPKRVAILGGSGQRATVGAELAKPMIVRVVDANGNGVSNAMLTVSPSAGSVASRTVRTDSTGRASIRWTMGRVAGLHTVVVQLGKGNEPIEMVARALPAAPASLTLGQETTRTGGQSRTRIVAAVVDSFGNPVPGAKVSLTARGGAVSPAKLVTDASGKAQTRWSPAAKASVRSVAATVTGTPVKKTLEMGSSPKDPTRVAGGRSGR